MADRPTIGRRTLMGRTALGSAVVALGGVAACTPQDPDDPVPPSTPASSPPADENPLEVERDQVVELVAFTGRYRIAPFEALGEIYTDQWGPGLRVEEAAKVTSTLQPRFEEQSPPDVFVNGGSESLPLTELVGQGALTDLGPLLDARTVDDEDVRIRDLLRPEAIEAGTVDGTVVELHYALAVWGLWHSKGLFEHHDWEPASTMDAFMTLCEQIASTTSQPPLVHGGLHAETMATLICHQAIKQGGQDVLLKLDNLDPDAWTQDAVFATVKRWEEIAAEGWIHPDSATLDAVEAEQRWLAGEAALVPGGSWLESEVGGIPEGITAAFSPLPSLDATDELPYEALGTDPGLPFSVPEQASNRNGGLEFLRMALSEDGVRAFQQATGAVCTVIDAADQVEDPSAVLSSVLEAVDAAGDDLFDLRCLRWYGELRTAARDTTRRLLSGEATTDQFVATMQRATDRVAGDPQVTKFRRT